MKEEVKWGKKSNFIPSMKNDLKQKKRQTVDDLSHVTCFVLQSALPTATGDISNVCYRSNHFTYKLYFLLSSD
jgi:hypothetical protein